MAHISTQTRRNIKLDIVKHFARGDEALQGLPIPLATTATAAGVTTLDDSKLSRGTTDANAYDGRMVEIIETVASSPTIGSVAGVDDAGFDGTDTLTLSPAYDATPQSGTDYLIYPLGQGPDQYHEMISEVLRQTEAPHLFIPSLVVDNDFEVGDITTNWTTQGSPTTSQRITTAASVFLGDAVFHFIADAAGEGTASDAIDVTEKENLTLSTFVRANVGSVQVILFNNTASTNIEEVTIDEQAWTEVRFTRPVPDNCEQVSVRYLSAANLDDFYISAFVTLQTQNERPYDLPSWFTHEGMFEGANYLPQGWASEDADSYIALSRVDGNVGIEPEFLRSDQAVHPMKVHLRAHINQPIWFKVRRGFADLTTDAALTHADRDFVVQKVIHKISGDLVAKKEAARLAKLLDYGKPMPRIREDKLVFVGSSRHGHQQHGLHHGHHN